MRAVRPVRSAVGVTEEFKVEVGLLQGSALSPFLFMVMDRLTDEVRQESPWTMMFTDAIVICSESREQVEEKLERWRYAPPTFEVLRVNSPEQRRMWKRGEETGWNKWRKVSGVMKEFQHKWC